MHRQYVDSLPTISAPTYHDAIHDLLIEYVRHAPRRFLRRHCPTYLYLGLHLGEKQKQNPGVSFKTKILEVSQEVATHSSGAIDHNRKEQIVEPSPIWGAMSVQLIALVLIRFKRAVQV